MAMALVKTPTQFYLTRFLIGLAEAGFFPGVIVYFTHWFPRAERARALAGFILAIPLSSAVGAKVSGALMMVDGWGLSGWQWLFLVEGLPAVLLGAALPFVMTDRPRLARWLTPAEQKWLEETLQAERGATAAGHTSIGRAFLQPAVWLLALGILATNTGGYALGFWLPTAMSSLLRELRGGDPTPSEVLNWTSLYFLCGLAGIWLAGQSSDRTGERKFHCMAGQILTGVSLAAAMTLPLSWGGVFFFLCLTGFFMSFWPPPFWVLPTLTLSPSAAAVAVGFVNICASVAGMIGPPVVGWMKEAGLDFRTCLVFAAMCYVLGGLIIGLLRVPRGSAA
jgi:ACS family tartrate transporter-like MFS transporter